MIIREFGQQIIHSSPLLHLLIFCIIIRLDIYIYIVNVLPLPLPPPLVVCVFSTLVSRMQNRVAMKKRKNNDHKKCNVSFSFYVHRYI